MMASSAVARVLTLLVLLTYGSNNPSISSIIFWRGGLLPPPTVAFHIFSFRTINTVKKGGKFLIFTMYEYVHFLIVVRDITFVDSLIVFKKSA
jgi:hypothetical protein